MLIPTLMADCYLVLSLAGIEKKSNQKRYRGAQSRGEGAPNHNNDIGWEYGRHGWTGAEGGCG